MDNKDIKPLILILVSIVFTFLIARLIAYLVISSYLPSFLFLSVNDFKIHHFVYGNILILISAYLAIVFPEFNINKNILAITFGVGLGLILDEFMLWIGNVKHLTSVEMYIPYSFTAIIIVCLIVLISIFIKLKRKNN